MNITDITETQDDTQMYKPERIKFEYTENTFCYDPFTSEKYGLLPIRLFLTAIYGKHLNYKMITFIIRPSQLSTTRINIDGWLVELINFPS